MEKIIINSIILSSIAFFVGCSETTPKADTKLKKESLSVYNIMGIEEPKLKPKPIFIVEEPKNYQRANISNNIDIISYQPKRDILKLKNSIEWNAKSFLGTKYVWGATGPATIDCSGFTQWVYRDIGIDIPRVSRNQARVGEYVRYENLQRGDMVFFDTKRKRSGKVTHVGIYLGNGNFIHASSNAKKVVIYNFNEKEFYKKRFLWGRRVLYSDHLYYALN